MDKHAVAIVLEEIGTLLEIQGENRFKSRAFTGAARAVEKLERDLNELVREHALENISGIGPATAKVIEELVTTGTAQYYQQLRERTPPGLLQLLSVPRLGATRIRLLHDELGISSVDDLERAARTGQIASLKGFGARTEQQILEGLAHARASTGRRRYADAIELGQRLRGFVGALPGVARAELAGDLRRSCETVAAIEIVAAADEAQAAAAITTVLQLPGLTQQTRPSAREAVARLADQLTLRLLCVPPAEYAAALITVTGSDAHVGALREWAAQQDFDLQPSGLWRADGVRVEASQESDIYAALQLQFIPPELRETGRELTDARAGTLPQLVEYEQLRGCFHCHTVYSDGKATVAQMAVAAQERGFRYLGIADHSQYAGYAGGLSPEDVARQHREIDRWNEQHGSSLWLFKGIEADILPDGRLDYDDRPDVLASFDYVIGSVHSAFTLSPAVQTERFLRVLQNPHLTMFGHLTGRLLLARRGCQFDLDTVLDAAARRGVAIEINSDPRRMEMDWRHWPRAKTLGIRTAINPDAHSQGQLDFLHNGITIARKGWLESRDVVNTWTLSEVQRFFRQARRA